MVDTSILIDFYRKTDKNRSAWLRLVKQGFEFSISYIFKFEVYTGATPAQLKFWHAIFKEIQILPFDEACVDNAVAINKILKQKRKQIEIADLFIAAVAITHRMPFATLNKKHFDRIDGLILIEDIDQVSS